jgi:hypothetical protein
VRESFVEPGYERANFVLVRAWPRFCGALTFGQRSGHRFFPSAEFVPNALAKLLNLLIRGVGFLFKRELWERLMLAAKVAGFCACRAAGHFSKSRRDPHDYLESVHVKDISTPLAPVSPSSPFPTTVESSGRC